MSADLQNLASRKLTVARQRATQAQRELRETVALLQRLEHDNHVMFPWVAEKVQTQLLTETQIESADYLGSLQVAEITVKTNGELVRKSVESTKDWLKMQRDAVMAVRRSIDVETQKRDATVRGANDLLQSKEEKARNIEMYTKLPEKSVPQGGMGCALAAACGIAGFFVGIPVLSLFAGLLNTFFPWGHAVGLTQVTMGICWLIFTLLGAIAPSTWGARLIWRMDCKNARLRAKEEAEHELIETQERHPGILATAEREFQEQVPQLQEALAKAEILERGAQEAHHLAEAHLAAPRTELRPSPLLSPKSSTIEVKIPEVGLSTKTVVLATWLKSDGELVNAGDPIFEYETLKVFFEVKAEQTGVLRVKAAVGAEVEVGSTVAIIEGFDA